MVAYAFCGAHCRTLYKSGSGLNGQCKKKKRLMDPEKSSVNTLLTVAHRRGNRQCQGDDRNH